MASDPDGNARRPDPARRARAGARPSWRPLAAIGGGLASAVLAGAAWTATSPPQPVSHRSVRESERPAADAQGLARAPLPGTAPVRAGNAALAAVGSGRVVQVAAGPGGTAGRGYVVQVATSGGAAAHVLVDDRFVVRSVRVDD